MPDQYEFTADEERAMRQKNARLAQVAPEFEPAAAQEARVSAARRLARGARPGKMGRRIFDEAQE